MQHLEGIGALSARRLKLKMGNEGSLFRTGQSSWPLLPPGPSLLEACGCRAFPKLEQGSSNRRFLPAFLVSSNSAQAYWGGATATSRPCVPGSAWLMLCLSVPGFTRLMQCTRNLERTFLSVPTPPPTPLHLQAAAAAAPATGHLPCLGKFLVSHVHHHLRICRTVLCSPATP